MRRVLEWCESIEIELWTPGDEVEILAGEFRGNHFGVENQDV